ncbi:trypsin alpha-3 [Culex quinquefasciatus]|uniref:trypsin alpha-3 n=1 Tax=Culex quinquefasciatus TaxID=7176 RepID=UPI0018E33010|nr:trypsin alpha-3 [Culex quinquefasciatus]
MYRQLLPIIACLYLWTTLSVDSTSDAESRIVGGNNATFYVCSHTVAIRQVNRDFLCNGVLISSRDVLTAASCVSNVRNESDLVVVAGTIGNSVTAPGAIPLSVSKLWSTTSNPSRTGDIALLRLNATLITGGAPWISVVELGTRAPTVNQSCSLCGWGSGTISGPPALILQTININVQSNTSPNCTRAAGGTALPANAICAGDPLQAGRGACTHDVGAPLMCNGALHGVLTVTGGCGGLHEVSVFADTAAHLAWIRNRTQTGVVVVPPNKPGGGGSGGNGPGGSAQASVQLGMMVIAVVTAFVLR